MMSDLSTTSWSETDASNNQSSPEGWPTGMLPNGVEPSARMNMGAVKRHWNRINPVYSAATTGTDVYTITPSAALTGYGLYERWRARFQRANNSSSTTIVISSLPAQPLRKYDGSGNIVNVNPGDLQPIDHEIWWDGTEFILTDPSAATATRVYFTVTSTTCTIGKQSNVGSVAYNSTGDYTINFAAALADANYEAQLTLRGNGGQQLIAYENAAAGSRSTSSCRISVVNLAGASPAVADPTAVSLTITD